MPEATEIRSFTDFIKKYVNNQNLLDIKILDGRYKHKGAFKFYRKLVNKLPLKVTDVDCKGKFMYITLENEYYIGLTMGLSGGIMLATKSTTDEKIINYKHGLNKKFFDKKKVKKYMETALKHLNVEFVFPNNSIMFHDQLSYGTIKVFQNKQELNDKLNSIGPDIMKVETTFDIFKERIKLNKNQDKHIGNVLMDQKKISGIGNFLRSEILYLSRISPFRKVKDIDDNELRKIYKNARLLIWGQYDYNKGVKLNIINKTDKLSKDYKRDFFVYSQDKDIHGNDVTKEELYEGSQKRFIYWVKKLQK